MSGDEAVPLARAEGILAAAGAEQNGPGKFRLPRESGEPTTSRLLQETEGGTGRPELQGMQWAVAASDQEEWCHPVV